MVNTGIDGIEFCFLDCKFSPQDAMHFMDACLIEITAAYAGLNTKYLSRESVLATRPAKLIVAMGILACFSAIFGISLGNSAFFIISTYSKTLIYALLLIAAIPAFITWFGGVGYMMYSHANAFLVVTLLVATGSGFGAWACRAFR